MFYIYEIIYWYWIYSGIGYILPTIGGYMSIGGVTLYTYSRLYVHILENAYSPTLLPKGALTPSK